MRTIRAGLRSGLLLLLAAALVVGLVGASPRPAVAAGRATATEVVNVRSGPSTAARVLGQVDRGQILTTTGTSGSWTRVSYRDRTGYVASRYLRPAAGAPAASSFVSGTVRLTTETVNLRAGAGTSYALRRLLPAASRVTVRGPVRGGFAEVVASGTRGWVSTRYLSGVRNVLPAVVGTRVATAALDIRTTAGPGARTVSEVAKGTRLSITGVSAGGRAQVVYRSAARWVTAQYLANPVVSLPGAPGLPKVTGTRYATTALDIRSTSADRYRAIAEVPQGTALKITGVVEHGRRRIVFDGALRWATDRYLSRTRPKAAGSGGGYAVEKGLKPNAVKLHRAAMARFPQITTYYGVRKDSIPDHPSGRALDLMLPGNYRSASARALGKAIAGWTRTNARSLGIQYIIWDQHIWNIQRDREGWRFMASRGSDNANHKNHVHITVYG